MGNEQAMSADQKAFATVDHILEERGDCALDLAGLAPELNAYTEGGRGVYDLAHAGDDALHGHGWDAAGELLSGVFHFGMAGLNATTGELGEMGEVIHGAVTGTSCFKALAGPEHSETDDERAAREAAAAQAERADALNALARAQIDKEMPPQTDGEFIPNGVEIVPGRYQKCYQDEGSTAPTGVAPASPFFDWSSINAIPATEAH